MLLIRNWPKSNSASGSITRRPGCVAKKLAAPHANKRARIAWTGGKNLESRAVLHDYDCRADKRFDVLELILTAPVAVASRIRFQYYGSTVATALFGSGNKLLHNVVGGIGVIGGNGGLLQTGLPQQSVFSVDKDT